MILPTAYTMTFSSVVGSSSDGSQEAPPSVVCVFTNPMPWARTKHSDSILMSGIGQKWWVITFKIRLLKYFHFYPGVLHTLSLALFLISCPEGSHYHVVNYLLEPWKILRKSPEERDWSGSSETCQILFLQKLWDILVVPSQLVQFGDNFLCDRVTNTDFEPCTGP